MQDARAGRRGMMLGVVLVGALVAGVVGMALADRSMRSLRTGRWSRDHLVLRLAAESAVEELHLRVQQAANRPGEPVFTALRKLPDGDAYEPAPLPVRASAVESARPEMERQLAGKIAISASVVLRKLLPVSADPLERCGVVRYEATARLTSGRSVSIERVRMEHAFRSARVTPPRPLDQVGLFVGAVSGPLFEELPEGSAVFSGARAGPQSLLEMVTSDVLVPLPPSSQDDVALAINAFAPRALSMRAQYVTTSAAELGAFIRDRLEGGRPLNGLIHNFSRETIELKFPSFRGKCLISASGPVSVGDIRLEDPARDSLTIVSSDRIVVSGRRVDAVLVNFSDMNEGVVFAARSVVRGGVLSSRFPMGLSLSGLELESCQIEHQASLDSGDAPTSSPDTNLLSRYVVAFSPHPVSLEHQRDREEWSGW